MFNKSSAICDATCYIRVGVLPNSCDIVSRSLRQNLYGKVLFKMKDRLFSDFLTTKIFESKSSLKILTTLIENKTLFYNTKLTSIRIVFCLNKTFLTFRL